MILHVLLTLWGVWKQSCFILHWTDKGALKFVGWKSARLSGHRASHTGESCNAKAHKLGNLPPETCSCLESKSKSLEEFNSWKTCIPSSTSTATWWREFQWREPTALAQYQSLYSSPVWLSEIPMKHKIKEHKKMIIEAYAIHIIRMHSNVCLSECMCNYFHVVVLLQRCYFCICVSVSVCVCVCVCTFPLGFVDSPFRCCV